LPLTSILDGERIEISQCKPKDRGKNFRCPECDEKMTLVFPEQRIDHFRHLKSTCGFYETYEHLAMKKNACDLLKKFNLGQFNFEVRVKNIFNLNVIDLELIQKDVKIAIECQASSMIDNDCYNRTYNLNRLGYHVLWLLSANNFDNDQDERLIKQPESFVHTINFDRVYYLKILDKPIIYPLHFINIERKRDVYKKELGDGNTYYFSEMPDDGEYDEHYSYSYILAKKRKIIYGNEIKDLSILCRESIYSKTGQEFNLAQFFDEKFW